MLAATWSTPVAGVFLTFELASVTSRFLTFSCLIGTPDRSIQRRFGKRNIQVSIVNQLTDEFAEFLFVSGHAFDSEQLVVCTQLQHILGDSLLEFSPVMVGLKNTSRRDTTALLALMESLKKCAKRTHHYASGHTSNPESGTVCWFEPFVRSCEVMRPPSTHQRQS